MSIEGALLIFLGGFVAGFVICVLMFNSGEKDTEESRIWFRKNKFYRLVPLEPPK